MKTWLPPIASTQGIASAQTVVSQHRWKFQYRCDRPIDVGRVGVTDSSLVAGLSAAEAAARLAADGPNELPVPRGRPAILRLAGDLVHAFALMLWVAAALAWIAGLPALTVAIAAVVVLNAGFAFVQEERAGRAADRLRRLMPTRVNVRRDGSTVVIDATEVVRGDRVLLEAGDRIPADGEVTNGALQLDTSMLTGESATDVALPGDAIWAGTFAVEGDAEMAVTATGGHTRVAALAALSSKATKSRTPLTIELERLVRSIAVIAVAIGLVFFAVLLMFGPHGRPGSNGQCVRMSQQPTDPLGVGMDVQSTARSSGLDRAGVFTARSHPAMVRRRVGAFDSRPVGCDGGTDLRADRVCHRRTRQAPSSTVAGGESPARPVRRLGRVTRPGRTGRGRPRSTG